jgi:hypothetical protein
LETIDDDLLGKYKNMLIVGDANIDLLEKNTTSAIYKSIIYTNNYNIINRLDKNNATRVTDTTSTIIDHIIDDRTNNKHTIQLLDWPGFDHKLIKIILTNIPKPKKIMQNLEYIALNKKQFITNVHNDIKNNKNQINMEKFVQIINTAKDKASSIKHKRTREDNNWMNADLIKLIEIRNNLYSKQKKRTASSFDKEKFKLYKNLVTRKIKMAKSKYIQTRIKDAGSNSKKLWSIINNVMYNHRNSHKSNVIDEIITDNGVINDSKSIAKEMNNYFVSIGQKLYSNIKKSKQSTRANYDSSWTPINSVFMSPTDNNEVSCIINSMKNSSSSGSDGITSSDLKTISEEIIGTLVNLINTSFNEGKFPDCLKHAIITPIHKAGPKNEQGNYRPISILSTLSKVLEKIIYNRLTIFLKGNGGIDSNQYGFQKGSNTTSTLTDAIEYINNELDRGMYVVAIFVDLSKAFDTVDHATLFHSLDKLGLRGNANKLLQSYLQQRTVSTKNGNTISSPRSTTIGVPQGSILGPLLYLLYIDNLKYQKLEGKYYVYADDTLLIYSGLNPVSLEEKINNDLKKFASWLMQNYLTINENKTNYLVFSQKNKPAINLKLVINKTEISRTHNVKYLGLNLDDKLDWSTHINKKIEKLSPIIGIMRRTDILSTKIKHTLYNSFILPHVTYGLTVWSQCSLQQRNTMQRLMNKSLKLIFGLHRLTRTSDLYKLTEKFKLEDLIFMEKVKHIHKIKSGQIKSNIRLTISSDIHTHNTRQTSQLRTAPPRTNRKRYSFLHSSVKIYNSLPDVLRKIKNTTTFKSKLKTHIKTRNITTHNTIQ